ncbi:MAG TPA: helix-turn-helix transcriptional regulator [Thermoanaerobaculia bacterium]|jgi:transcriptional regulator with XRE-family HTH domain
MIGNKLREVRQSQSLSLTAVATKARISAATLSRIETNKQGVDLGLFLILARILRAAPNDLLSEEDQNDRADPLVLQIASLQANDRTRLWRDLAAQRRVQRSSRRTDIRNLGQQVEELLAQIEFLQEELESVRTRVKRRR